MQLNLLEPIDRYCEESSDLGLTFRDSKGLPVHRWYPYVEGFAADYIRSLFRDIPASNCNIYDPFGGSGTVCVIASSLGHKSAFSELNPFMRFIAETKVNSVKWAKRNQSAFEASRAAFLRALTSRKFDRLVDGVSLANYEAAFPDRDFFVEKDIRELLAAKALAEDVSEGAKETRSLLMLAISSVLVHNSNMTRRADLRRRKPGEYKGRVVDVRRSIRDKMDEVAHDIQVAKQSAKTRFVNDDARIFVPQYEQAFDKIITSPPYLNGTNYFRNTKIELWFLDYLQSEEELSGYNDRCVSGGINNVSGRRNDVAAFSSVELVVERLNQTEGDKRIGKMVRQYFNDMKLVLQNCTRYLKPGALLHLDIGDSKFYGVHVPTDRLLIDVAKSVNFRLEESKVLARRHSRDKTPLTQVELTFAHGS